MNDEVARLARHLDPVLWSFDFLKVGVENGFLSPIGAVRAEAERMRLGLNLSFREVDLAIILPDDPDAVAKVLALGDPHETADEFAMRAWTYVLLWEVCDRWDTLSEPWEAVADLLESVGNPADYERFEYLQPVPLFSRPPGLQRLRAELYAKLSDEERSFGEL